MSQNQEKESNQLMVDLAIETDASILNVEDSIEQEMIKPESLLIQEAEALNRANVSDIPENNNETLITE